MSATRWWTATAVLIALAGPARAQLEPHSFTALKSALADCPPRPADAARALLGCRHEDDFRCLMGVWLKQLSRQATGTVEDRREKVAALLDAFNDSFAEGDAAFQRAKTFIRLRDRLFQRDTSKNEVARSAAVLVTRLRELPHAERQALRELGRLARASVNAVVE